MLSIIDGLGRGWVRQVVFMGEGPVVDEVRRREIPVSVIPKARRGGLLISAVRARSALRSSGASLVHANGSRAAIVAALATIGTRTKLVWLKVDSSRDGRIARLIGRRCARIVGISHAVNETFRGRGRRALRVVYPGVPRRAVDRRSARKVVTKLLDSPPEVEVVVIAARLTPNKGQLDLIEAAPHLLAERPQLRIALLGGETWPWEGYEKVLRTRALELGVDRSVSFLGHRPPGIENNDDVVRFIAGCDVLAAPSSYERVSGWREGFGYSPVEAMSVKVPVVAYRHGSFPEVLGDCACFVREGDTEALAVAITQVLDDRELARQLVRCGAERANRYRPENTVAGMKAVYRELALSHG